MLAQIASALAECRAGSPLACAALFGGCVVAPVLGVAVGLGIAQLLARYGHRFL